MRKPCDSFSFWLLGIVLATAIASTLQAVLGETSRGFVLVTGLALVCMIAAVIDATTRRIPNGVTYPAILLAVGANLAVSILSLSGLEVPSLWLGGPGLPSAVAGLLACGGIGLVGFVVAGLGGGDVKLFALVGAALGLGAGIGVMANALCFAMVFAIANLISDGRLLEGLRAVGLAAFAMLVTGRPTRLDTVSTTTVPLAPAVLLGLLVTPYVDTSRWIFDLVG